MKDNKHNPSPIAPASTAPSKAAATARNASAEGTTGKLIKKKGAQAGDPTGAGSKANRVNKKKAPGRAYGITASMPAWKDPAIAAVQSNGRVFTAALNRTAPNFQAGSADLD